MDRHPLLHPVMPDTTSPIQIMRRRGQLARPDDRRLQRALASGEWVRVAPGSFARGADWARLTPLERHRAIVIERLHRLTAPATASHRSAAALWRIDTLGRWPSQIEVTTDRANGGRSGGAVRRYVLGLELVERVPFGEHQVTTPAQTALDLARTLPFAAAVAAVDQSIWTGRGGGPLTTIAEIEMLLDSLPRGRGDARARRVLAFANPLAANVRESP